MATVDPRSKEEKVRCGIRGVRELSLVEKSDRETVGSSRFSLIVETCRSKDGRVSGDGIGEAPETVRFGFARGPFRVTTSPSSDDFEYILAVRLANFAARNVLC